MNNSDRVIIAVVFTVISLIILLIRLFCVYSVRRTLRRRIAVEAAQCNAHAQSQTLSVYAIDNEHAIVTTRAPNGMIMTHNVQYVPPQNNSQLPPPSYDSVITTTTIR